MDCPFCHSDVESGADRCTDCGLLFHTATCVHHPDRQAVARCVICSDAVCRHCVVAQGRRHFCPAHTRVEVMDGHAVVSGVSTAVEAELLKGQLEAAGIPAWIHSQKDSVYAVNFGPLAPVKVLVPRAYLEQARLLVADLEAGAGALRAGCPRCGRPLPDDDQTCPYCT